MEDTIEGMTPERVREIRNKLGINQSRFWNEIGFSLQQGSSYERHRFNQDNKHLKQAVFMRYVLGIPLFDSEALREMKTMADFGKSAAAAINRSKPERKSL